MTDIRPFRGIRYNQEKVENLDAVVTPPYDVISPEDRMRYEQKHLNNIVRLILPDSVDDKYEKSASLLHEWLDQDVLVRDENPCLYACVQEYQIGGTRKRRFGFTCLVRLEDFDRRTVLPHEKIMARPLEDRLNLIRHTKANFDSVFGLYAGSQAPEILKSFVSGEPDASATDADGVKCDLFRISDPNAIMAVAEVLADESIVIADGHHRYSAALAYRDEMRSRAGTHDPEAPYEYVMMTLVSLDDEGLIVLPTHRLVGNLEDFDLSAFLAHVAKLFDVKDVPPSQLQEALESLGDRDYVYGMYAGAGRAYLLSLKPKARPEELIESPGSDALKQLDVSVLHSLMLEQLLGIDSTSLSNQSNIAYTRDVDKAICAVDRGDQQLFFMMNPTRVDEVKAVAAAGDRMPQKSTFFYPKLLTGIILRAWDDS